jgi:hypothetical protein
VISKDKQYRTIDGDEVRIYATDGEPTAEVHGAYKSSSCGNWIPSWWNKEGEFHGGDLGAEEMNLIEVKPRIKRTYWLNIYKSELQGPTALWTRKDADRWVPEGRIACVKVEIDCEEGEGL